jgi:hypothetical protein
MSTYFSKVIKAGDRLREFNFRLTRKGTERVYNVDVVDERGNRHFFQLLPDAEGMPLILVTNVPAWVEGAQPALIAAIEEHLAPAQKTA